MNAQAHPGITGVMEDQIAGGGILSFVGTGHFSAAQKTVKISVNLNHTLPYSIGQTAKLRKRLETEIQKVI